MKSIQFIAVPILGDIKPGGLGPLVLQIIREVPLYDHDIVIIAQKAISKAEGAVIPLADVIPSVRAQVLGDQLNLDPRLVEVIIRQGEVIRISHTAMLIRTVHGIVCVNGGVDQSNTGKGLVTVLPLQPDISAKKVRQLIKDFTKREVATIITDTNSRFYRNGIVNQTIGISGINPVKSYVGETDPYGYVLQSSCTAIVDEIAAGAGLLMGKFEGVPAVVLRGYTYEPAEFSASLIYDTRITKAQDLLENQSWLNNP
ncbi:MAG: coenzyme F420-0:L-glutamate ligase [Nitrososphaerales archaeon]